MTITKDQYQLICYPRKVLHNMNTVPKKMATPIKPQKDRWQLRFKGNLWTKSSFEKWAFNWHIQCYCTPHCDVHDGKSGVMICGHKVYTNFVTKKMIWKLENWSAF